MKRIVLFILIVLFCSCSRKKEKIMFFKNIGDALTHPLETKMLRIEGKDLKLLDDHIDSFPNLESLAVVNHKWVIVNPDGKVNMHDVVVVRLPEHIGKLKNLKELALVNYYVDSLPNDISSLTQLRSLMFAYTDKANLNEEVRKLEKLKKLESVDLTNSLITHSIIRAKFKEMSNISLKLFYGDVEPEY